MLHDAWLSEQCNILMVEADVWGLARDYNNFAYRVMTEEGLKQVIYGDVSVRAADARTVECSGSFDASKAVLLIDVGDTSQVCLL
ncbi:hypothetical protein OURE66S_02762 [Oligella ureolytica]